jgi:hypothetical protein
VSEALATLWRGLVAERLSLGPAPTWLVGLVAVCLLAMLIEALVLLAWHRRSGRGLPPRSLLPTLVAGGALMAALLAVLTGAPPVCLLALLALAGVAHVLDLQRRWVAQPARRR